jgi:hypothetical protein
MSDKTITTSPPSLSPDLIELAKMDLHLHGLSDGWGKYNAIPEDEQILADHALLFNTKGIAQIDNIHSWVSALHGMIRDFEKQEFKIYIDFWGSTCSEKEEETGFNPWDFLSKYLNSETFATLPEDIAQYREMLAMLNATVKRRTLRETLVSEFWQGMDVPRQMVNDLTPGLAIKMRDNYDVNYRLDEIEIEHCLDYYNEWRKALYQAVNDRIPFSEMLKLFK